MDNSSAYTSVCGRDQAFHHSALLLNRKENPPFSRRSPYGNCCDGRVCCGSWRLERKPMTLFERLETDALGCAETRSGLRSRGFIRLLAMFILTASAVAQQTTKDLS